MYQILNVEIKVLFENYIAFEMKCVFVFDDLKESFYSHNSRVEIEYSLIVSLSFCVCP